MLFQWNELQEDNWFYIFGVHESSLSLTHIIKLNWSIDFQKATHILSFWRHTMCNKVNAAFRNQLLNKADPSNTRETQEHFLRNMTKKS